MNAENGKGGWSDLIKTVIICGLTVFGLFLFIAIWFIASLAPDNLSKNQIFSAVRENQAFLLDCVAGSDPEQAKQIKGVQSVRYDADEDYYEFYCGGAGIVPASSYYGFYYSPQDAPLAVDATQTENLSPVQGGYGWRETKGDNSYYTERIMENWYYYESHY
ncbi:MAG: hypothetical protein IKP72_02555 [Clostridia bacterium]|nr:hypothetical protein [Clostridia bacterium]